MALDLSTGTWSTEICALLGLDVAVFPELRAAADGESLLSPTVTRTVISTFTQQRRPATHERHPRLDDLTEREREVLELLAQGLNNDELAARQFIIKATARTHVSHILLKLGARDRAQLVVIAYQSGVA